MVNALVDRANSPVKTVKIFVSNTLVNTLTAWPYQTTVDPSQYGSGIKTIKVIVEDQAGVKVQKVVDVEF